MSPNAIMALVWCIPSLVALVAICAVAHSISKDDNDRRGGGGFAE